MSKSKKKDDISSKLADLTKALEDSPKELVQGPALTSYDLTIPYSHMFSTAAKHALSRKVTELNPKRKTLLAPIEGEVYDKVEFFSAIAVGPEKVVKAARIITDLINHYAAKGYVTGCLAPLSYIKLFSEPHELPKYAIFCFVAMSDQGCKALEAAKCPYAVLEGMIGPEVT